MQVPQPLLVTEIPFCRFQAHRALLTFHRINHSIRLVSYFRHSATIPDYKKSYALILGKFDVKTAVIFVHGFFGDSKKTWFNFQSLADRFSHKFPWWADSDMFFFDYDDVTGSIGINSSRDFAEFLSKIYPKPDKGIFAADLSDCSSVLHLDIPVVRLRDDFAGYKELVLVGHSEGAVVIRHAIERLVTKYIENFQHLSGMLRVSKIPKIPKKGGGYELPTQPVKQSKPIKLPNLSASGYPELEAKLCLFAPALMGASPSGVLGIIAKKIHLLHSFLAYNELQPNAALITNLQKRTEEYAKQYPQIPALKARILWGEDENIVAPDRYQFDDEEDPEPGKDHTSICKPRPDYTRPLEFVRYGTRSSSATI